MFGYRGLSILSNAARFTTQLACVRSNVVPISCQRAAGNPRSFTRSMWYLASSSSEHTAVTLKHRHSSQCGCCKLHTEGDQELIKFLKDEINLEKSSEKNPGQLPRFQGFEVSADQADVTISKKIDGETITVKWNVTDTVDDDQMEPEFDQSEEQEGPIVSKPMFTVFLNKGASQSLALQCAFPPAMPEEIGEDHMEDPLDIAEVAIVNGTEWDSKVYSVMSSVMDRNLYSMLMNMLEDRGVNQDFMDELLDFSTSYEHKQYIGFLTGLHDFVKK